MILSGSRRESRRFGSWRASCASTIRFLPGIGLLLAMSSFATAASAGDTTFSVVTLNLWHDEGDWTKRLALIAKTLKASSPDLIALQEVLQRDGLPNQAQTLAAALGYRYAFVSVDPPGAAKRYGNAILTKHRIAADDWKALQPLDDYRTVAHARVVVGARTVELYATHLDAADDGADIRRRQAGDLLDYVHATASGGPVLVVGDFNAPADAPELSALAAVLHDAYDTRHPAAAQDALEHSTLNTAYYQYSPLRIDHILFDPARFRVVDCRRLFDSQGADGTWASDHFGVWARFEWRDR
jgi:endonuclease/exonuclease/phosphatase family metal-dependent hydrolase